jgi:DNA-binding transcriptional MerR regulator
VINVKLETMKSSFTKKQVAEAIGISLRTVQFYTDDGLLIPEIANPSGRGTSRKYSRKNLVEFLIIKELAQYGLSLGKIKAIMEKARSSKVANKWDPEGTWVQNKRARLIIYGLGSEDMKIRMEDGYRIQLMMDEYRAALVINIEDILIQVDEVC